MQIASKTDGFVTCSMFLFSALVWINQSQMTTSIRIIHFIDIDEEDFHFHGRNQSLYVIYLNVYLHCVHVFPIRHKRRESLSLFSWGLAFWALFRLLQDVYSVCYMKQLADQWLIITQTFITEHFFKFIKRRWRPVKSVSNYNAVMRNTN